MKSIVGGKTIFVFLIQILNDNPFAIAWIPSEHFSSGWSIEKCPIEQRANSVFNLPTVLRVTVLPNEPFFYQNQNGEIHSGIEYQIMETVAKKINMTASYQIWHDNLPDYNQLLLKYVQNNISFISIRNNEIFHSSQSN